MGKKVGRVTACLTGVLDIVLNSANAENVIPIRPWQLF